MQSKSILLTTGLIFLRLKLFNYFSVLLENSNNMKDDIKMDDSRLKLENLLSDISSTMFLFNM